MYSFFHAPNKLRLTRGEFRKTIDEVTQRCERSYIRLFLEKYKYIVCTLDKTQDLHFDINSDIDWTGFDQLFGYVYENDYLFSEISKQLEPTVRLPELTMVLIFELRRQTSEPINLFASPDAIAKMAATTEFSNVFNVCPYFEDVSMPVAPDYQSKMYDGVFNIFKSTHVPDSELAIALIGREVGQYQIRTLVKNTKTEYRVDKGITIDLDAEKIIKISKPVSDKINVVKLTK